MAKIPVGAQTSPKTALKFWGHKIRPSAPAPRLMSSPGAEGKERHSLGLGAGAPTQWQLKAGVKEDAVESWILGA